MSNSCGSLEDAGKQRGRDAKIRREDVDDSQPEGKRLRLGNEGGSAAKERAAADAAMPCSGTEEPVPQGGGEGKSVSEHPPWERGKGRVVTSGIICQPEVGNWAHEEQGECGPVSHLTEITACSSFIPHPARTLFSAGMCVFICSHCQLLARCVCFFFHGEKEY